MVIIDYKKQYHKQIIKSCAAALRRGKTVVYPTDTSYGLAVDATNQRAVKNLFRLKGRPAHKPVHVVVPSMAYAKTAVAWGGLAAKLAGKFWPGPITLVLQLKSRKRKLKLLTAGTGYLGLRYPDSEVALDLAKYLKRPITATSANVSGRGDGYDAGAVIKQFEKSGHKPDVIINAGKLARKKPSTVVKISNQQAEILRPGPISEKEIKNLLAKPA
jgi:L-threonylcarbamoyladenylate synthase